MRVRLPHRLASMLPALESPPTSTARTIGCIALALLFANSTQHSVFGFCNEVVIAGCPTGTTGHIGLTRAALSFLRQEVLDDITDEHVFVDVTGAGTPSQHFDNSQFTASVAHINNQYFGSLGVLDELQPGLRNVFGATDEFGQLLHTAQDFYAHTNWVDYNPASVPIFDDALGGWVPPVPYGVIFRGATPLTVIEGLVPPAPITSFTIVPAAGGVLRLIDVNTTNTMGQTTKIGDGLVSGAFGFGVMSPPGATIGHGSSNASDDGTTLNKDTSLRTHNAAAVNAAQRQTEHEWCRTLHLLNATYGQSGAAVAMGLMVDPTGSPHPADTACATPTETPQRQVNVRVTSIQVLDDTDPIGAGEMNFSFVLYTKDFQQSARTEVHSISVDSGATIPAASLPALLSLNLNAYSDLVLTLQSWDDDNSLASFDGVFDSSDETLRGALLDFTPEQFSFGSHVVGNASMRVTFEIGSNMADFNFDGIMNCDDINLLTEAVAVGGTVADFDLNGDGALTQGDVDAWRIVAGGVNLGPGRVYLPGDANLDSVVDGSDFVLWNAHKFTLAKGWCQGNFSADAGVDASDFGIWNANKFLSADGPLLVPEPSHLAWMAVVLCYRIRKRGPRRS